MVAKTHALQPLIPFSWVTYWL